jgi:hypothetical protein
MTSIFKYIEAVALGVVAGTFAYIMTADYMTSSVVFSATIVAVIASVESKNVKN